ncbi:DUF5343 domain-containing protein [Amycolatopsis nalaikhensis]|uniref:DUF5343 domain-containing protein n=1 Tax=Amycolatopsis nalaikhensis TaxID=715472 RepID=A0ABY8XZX4_9PSEU|nr:DUF5343 domain-containing protein [Amycolatopsis sp. 2-2]WIV61268.1 DUF5343 domain-containing protein [Amycolatopsis sp. 2-2]
MEEVVANTYPYISSAGPMIKTFERFRKQFPKEVTADTLRRLGVAPKNESYVINILRFLGLIDENGNKVEEKAKAFLQHEDEKFSEQIAEIVEAAYKPLFDLYGPEAWEAGRDQLVTYFRTTDGSSDVVGKRQAITFGALASLAGHGEVIQPRERSSKAGNGGAAPKKKEGKVNSAKSTTVKQEPAASLAADPGSSSRVGLTVRIEVNLPANGDQETYDAIFQSIRKNLIDGE